MFVTGLWELTARFLAARGVSEEAVHRWVPQGRRWPETPMCFATNFFVARRAWFVGADYRAYFDAVDESLGIYTHRWGDACIHMLAVAALLPRAAVLRLRSVPYWHQGTVLLPPELEPHAAEALGDEQPLPAFASSE